jgi:hypothetical protein
MSWKLKRTAQCAKCPWRVDVDPHNIPNGYCETKHRGLENTIAKPGALPTGATLVAMACHETDNAHCVGWLANQLGPGNSIALRLAVIKCSNIGRIRLVGKQHSTFEGTLPRR